MTPRPRPLDPDWVEARLHRDQAEGLHRDIAPDFTPKLTRLESAILALVFVLVLVICATPAAVTYVVTLAP